MQNNSIHRQRIDWTDVRTRVAGRAQGAQTIPDLYPAISLALGLLEDHHSFYRAPSGAVVGNPNARRCGVASQALPAIPADIGYVKVAGFGSSVPGAGVAFSDEIQDQIRSQDAPGLAGWIVDLRGNTGGNMWPMLAGVGPVLGDGVAGYFVPPLGAPSTPWGYQDGGAFSGGAEMARASLPYELIAPAPKVAVLTNGVVVSSGEAVAVAFRGRPNTRSFGTATCGLSTANYSHRLSDGATLVLTEAVMAGRNRTPYGDVIVPDESVAGDAEVVQRAIAWLH